MGDYAFLTPTEFLPMSKLVGVTIRTKKGYLWKPSNQVYNCKPDTHSFSVYEKVQVFEVVVRYKDIDGLNSMHIYSKVFATLLEAQEFVRDVYAHK